MQYYFYRPVHVRLPSSPARYGREQILFAILWMVCVVSVPAAPMMEEGFNYPNGSNLAQNAPWAGGSGASLSVVSGNLWLPGLGETAPAGNMLKVGGGVSRTVYRNFASTPVTNGALYFSALIKCTLPPTNSQPMAFFQTSGSTDFTASDNPMSLYILQANNGYCFRVAEHGENSQLSKTLAVNTTHLIVVKYGFRVGNQDRVILFIDPIPGGNEPTTPDAAISDVMFPNLRVMGFFSPSLASQGSWNFDTLRIGTNWADVTPVPTALILSGPQDQAACFGKGLTFSVAALGTAPFSYHWRTNGVFVPGATNAVFAVPNPTARDALNGFDVVVQDAFGSATSRLAGITFSTNPVAILTPPTNQVVLPGVASVTFEVAVSGDAPVSFQWRANGTAIANATNNSYSLVNPTMADQTTAFDVVGVNPCGAVTSSPPVFALFPNAFYAATDNGPGFFAGEILTLINRSGMTINVWSSPNLSRPLPLWDAEGPLFEVPLNDGSGNSQYSLNVVPAASPTYYVAGTGVDWPYLSPIPVVWLTTSDYVTFSLQGTNKIADASGVLSDPVPPGITQGPASQNVWLGTNAQFTVAASGSGPFSYQWWFNAAPLPGANLAAFKLTSVSRTNSGDYYVVVTSAFGSITSSIATLGVITPFYAAYDNGPGFFIGEILTLNNPSGMIINVWSSSTLSQPLPLWNSEGEMFQVPLNDGSGTSQYSLNVVPAASPTYYIAGISVSGPYPPGIPVTSLTTDDYVNFAVAQNQLPVGPGGLLALPAPPALTQQPARLAVIAGNPAEFLATATGSGLLYFQWRFNTNIAVEGGTNSSLLITTSTPAHAGNYFVVVTNNYGSATSQVAALTVLPPPALLGTQTAAGFQLTGAGVPGDMYFALAATNLNPPVTWQTVATNVADTNGLIQFVDGATQISTMKFYRLAFPSVLRMPPVILQQPTNRSVLTGTSPGFSVIAAGQAVLSYQWFARSNTTLAGATNSTLTLGQTSMLNNGRQYQVVVTNSWGSVTSSVATVTILPLPQLQAQSLSNRLQLTAQAVPGDAYRLQASTSLTPPVAWTTLATNLADALGWVQFSVTNIRTAPVRFYRLATP